MSVIYTVKKESRKSNSVMFFFSIIYFSNGAVNIYLFKQARILLLTGFFFEKLFHPQLVTYCILMAPI